jgi:hypothetical protein
MTQKKVTRKTGTTQLVILRLRDRKVSEEEAVIIKQQNKTEKRNSHRMTEGKTMSDWRRWICTHG